ncbi:hypothetical protein JIX56_41735 [Streptomyces sp. CA-210063]|uniref:hypothetical protein n=1 Tax=Streptomyces sp. CA-210063 TaxID=2801029 RepID=UPI00214B5B03|nr:hypothetical protein [Streptomyces sp. CA-210063]UUU35845.1 hypothetical protein JIX56_41735 [Streptomyces sp. CA-210063]
MTSATARMASAVVAAAALALTGACDSGGDGGTPETTRPPASDSSGSTPASGSPSVSVSPTPTGTAPEDPEEAEQEIRQAWRAFFDPESSLEERSAVVESGEQNALMIDNLFLDPLGSRLRADVTSVSYTTSEDATVTYTLTRDGRRLDTGGPGAAVVQDDTWKIALDTVCSLTRHAEDAPEAPSCE